jgi:hypothetical protein
MSVANFTKSGFQNVNGKKICHKEQDICFVAFVWASRESDDCEF